MPVLDNYPAEVWLEIVFCLEPRDVLALSHSCSKLYTLISRKEIWASILQSICCRHLLFLPSYPVDDMSLAQIQLAAMAPHRWHGAIERHHGLYDGGNDSMILRPSLKTPVTVDPTHKMRFLIPGGRFIVTANDLSIALWDIGVVGATLKSPPRLVARIEISTKDVRNFKICDLIVQQIENDLLRVGVSSMQGDLIARVFTISPTSPLAQFTELAQLHVQTQCNCVCDLTFQGNLLLMRLERTMSNNTMIWDFVKGQYAIWDIQRLAPKVEVTLLHNFIVHFVLEEVLAWKVPPLDDLPSLPATLSSFLIQPIPSSHAWSPFEFTTPLDFDMTFIRQSSWFHHPEIPYIFDALLIPPRNLNQRTMAYRYRLDLDSNTQDVNTVLLASYTFPDTHVYARIPHKARGGFQVGVSPGAIISRVPVDPQSREAIGRDQSCIFSVLPGLRAGEQTPAVGAMRPTHTSATAQLTPIQNRRSSSQYLCTGSGRLVSADVRGDGSKLWVADYLSRPSWSLSM